MLTQRPFQNLEERKLWKANPESIPEFFMEKILE